MITTSKENDFVLVTDDNFNEKDYLESNPDVAKAVLAGIVFSGRIHYTSSVYARKLITASRFFDFDPSRHENQKILAEDVESDEETVATILCDTYRNLQTARFLSGSIHNTMQ